MSIAAKNAHCYCSSLASGRCDFCTGLRHYPEFGDKVKCNGHIGFVTAVLDGQLDGMVEVSMNRGKVCVCVSQVEVMQ